MKILTKQNIIWPVTHAFITAWCAEIQSLTLGWCCGAITKQSLLWFLEQSIDREVIFYAPSVVIYLILFYLGASRATGSPRRERTIRRGPAWTKGESVSFASQALGAHALSPVKSFEPSWPHFMHSSSIHLPMQRPPQRPPSGLQIPGRNDRKLTTCMVARHDNTTQKCQKRHIKAAQYGPILPHRVIRSIDHLLLRTREHVCSEQEMRSE